MKQIDALRPIFLKVGLIVAMAFTYLLFNFTILTSEPEVVYEMVADSHAIEVIRTIQTEIKKRVPTPHEVKIAPIEFDSIEFKEPDSLDIEEPQPFDSTAIKIQTDSDVHDLMVPQHELPVVTPLVTEEKPMLFADKMPFYGDCRNADPADQRACSDKTLLEYVAKHLRYPLLARENRVQGLVVVEFVVQKDGSVSDIFILRDIGMGCGEESMRVLRQMQRWSAGINNGRPVPVIFRLPVRFRLQ